MSTTSWAHRGLEEAAEIGRTAKILACEALHNLWEFFALQSPEVVDTPVQGLPLVCGRIVIRDTPVPVVVYSRRLHVIDVWALPPALQAGIGSGARTVLGYNVLPFSAHGAHYIAASDLAGDEPKGFAKLLQDAPQARVIWPLYDRHHAKKPAQKPT